MTALLFTKSDLPRTAPVKRMHVADAGCGMIKFHCPHCGHNTGWIEDTHTISKNKRGLPCPECSEEAA